jgi:uncharacterized glyoxalase superfamily metalloenzyme YdcJ
VKTVATWELRSAFARSLSEMYGREVPAYTTLVEVAEEVNANVLRRDGEAAQRLGSIARVTAERHGAIRVGTPAELRQVGQIFAALGMHPVGFYDLRDAASSSVPVVSTAFRPINADELAMNPFRVFTSVLVSDDRRFFDAPLQEQLESFLSRRELFPPELLDLAARTEAEKRLSTADAHRFLELATASFELSTQPVDRSWYAKLEEISGVAADIGGVTSTHINHLTPRVLDIDDLYRRMEARGIRMIDEIQGPPRWAGPDLLLRQTSFRALSEPRRFREPDGSTTSGALRVRFGEVEARGIALTPAGRELYDEMISETDRRMAEDPALGRQEVAQDVWTRRCPGTEAELARQDLAFFEYSTTERTASRKRPPRDLARLVADGWVTAEPIVYEDFLPRSAAGIFQSNLDDEGSKDASAGGSPRDAHWLSEVLERIVHDPAELYAHQRQQSLSRIAKKMSLDTIEKDRS